MSSDSSLSRIHDAWPAGTPFAISEISDVVDCDNQTLREQLAELVADGVLDTKEIGGDERVWWRPVENSGNYGTVEQATEHLTAGDVIDIFPDLADVMMIAIDQTGEITLANAKACDTLGYTQDELVGANWFEQCVPDRLQTDVEGVFSQLVDGEIEPVERYENPVVTADGEERIIEWHNTILRDDDEIIGTLSSGLDITERKRAEESARDNEQQLEALIEATTEGVYRISPDWSEIYQLAGDGFLADDLPNTWQEYIPKSEQARVGDAIDEAIQTQSPFEMEHKIKQPDGTIGWTHSGAVPIIEDGEIIEWYGTATDITERKAREQKIKSQQEWRSAIFDGSRDAVFISDADANFVEVNAAAADLTGYDREELLSMKIPELHEETDMDAYREYNDQILDGDSILVEAQVLRADGSKIPVEFNNRHIEIDGDVYMHTTARDVTERKERDAELKRHKAYLESVSDLITMVDEEGTIQYDTPSVTEMLGYEQDERVCDPGLEYVHPDDRERVRERLQDPVSGSGVTDTYEYRAKTKDGEWIWVESTTRNHIDDPQINGIIVTARDITNRKEQQREKELLWQAIEKADSALTLAEPRDEDNPMVYVNEAFEDTTGYAKSEAIGRDCRFLQGEDTRAEPVNELREAIENGESVTVELRNYRKDGTEFWNRLTIDPVYDANGDLVRYLGTQEDITERKEQERKRNQVIDRVTDAIFETNADGEFTYVSDRTRQLLNATGKEFLGRDVFAVFDEAQGTEYEAQFNMVMETREPTSFVAPYPGQDWWFDVQAYPNDDGGISVYFRDVTERKKRERAQQRAETQYQTLFGLAPLPVIRVDIATDEIIEANDATEELLGYQADELVGQTRDVVYPDQYGDAYEDGFQRAVAHDGTIRTLPDGSSLRLATKDGREIPVEASTTTVTLDGRRILYGIFRDITDEKQYQRRLATLNNITQGLSVTETKRETKQTAADTLADILDVATVAFYRFDDTDWKLRPIVRADGADAGAAAETLPVIEPGNGVEWTALKNGETTIVDDFNTRETAVDYERPVRSEIAVPISEQCVLVVGATEPDTFDTWTVSLVETLGAATDAALTRTQQQQKLQQQNQELRELEALNKQIRAVAQTVVEADTRADLERLVCDRLTNAKQVDFAWIGRVNHQTKQLSPQTHAGRGQGYLDAVSLAVDGESGAEPSVQAAHSKTICDCTNTTAQLVESDWRSEAVERDFRSVLSLPLVHDERLYGVISMYSTTENGFSPALQSVLEELCDLLASAALAREQKEALHADQAVELRFEIQDQDSLFDRLASTDCAITLDGLVPQSGDTTLVFVRVTDGTAAQVVTRAERMDRIESSQVIETAAEPLVQISVTGLFIGTVLSRSEFVFTTLEATPTETQLVVEVPTAADTRQAVTLIDSQFEHTQLVGKQQVPTSSDTGDPFPRQILETLTSRQREVIEIAYRAGYFESPRRVNGAEVAELFGFSNTAFHKHIREIQSTLFAELLRTTNGSLPAITSADGE